MKIIHFIQFIIASLLFSSCIVIKPVEVRKLDRVRTDMNVQQPSILFDVDVMNPNGFGVTLKSVDVSLGLGEKNLAGISIERHLRIPRKGTATLPVKLQPSYTDLSAIAGAGLASFLGGKKEALSIRGEIVIGKFLFKRKLRFSEQITF